VLSLREPDTATLQRVLLEQQTAALSYREVAATARTLPEGYRHDRYAANLGVGDEAFRRAVEGLRNWEAHRGAGVSVFPSEAPLAEGTTVILVIRVGVLYAVAACRVVYVVDEPQRFGFAYGTLPLHPEEGEEAFIIERDADASVWFRIMAFSRPHDRLARVGAPVARLIQQRVTRGYLRSMERYVAS
jgi:uncharacterized protein (UPF0548 family)